MYAIGCMRLAFHENLVNMFYLATSLLIIEFPLLLTRIKNHPCGVSLFFMRTAKEWNSLFQPVLPDECDIDIFISRVNKTF